MATSKWTNSFLWDTASKDSLRQIRRTDGVATSRGRRQLHIGIIDIDVYAGFLPAVFSKINAAQKTFRVQMVVKALPAGLTISGQRTKDIIRESGKKISKQELIDNVYAGELYAAAKPLHQSSYDAIGLLVRKMVIDGSEKTGFDWNLFSTKRGKIFIASTFELRDYAAEAGRPFEACLAAIALSQAFATIFDDVEYHPETIGCLFDETNDRGEMVQALKNLTIKEDSLGLFPKWARTDTLKVTEAIRSYQRSD